MSNFQLAIVGECMIELMGQPFSALTQGFGGDTMNTAIYLKKLSPSEGRVSYVTGMGIDEFSQSLVDKWESHGVDIEYVMRDAGRNAGIYMIHNDSTGERSFQYWRNDSAARYIMQNESVAQVFRDLQHYDAVYFSGISLAILPEGDRALFLGAISKLKDAGVKIIFDSNYRPRLWASPEQTKACYDQAYRLSDLALITFDDEQALWGDPNVEACIDRLGQHAIAELVLKDGANGCHYITADTLAHYGTQVVEKVVDTTAAGDSFNAGYLYGWLNELHPKVCAAYGNRLAGQVIQQKGAIVDIPNLHV